MSWSEKSRKILDSNRITPDKEKEFIKDLRLCLRLDFGIPATEVRKLNDNKVIETWYEIHSRPENRISGQ
jgi:hypothetical protein